MCISHRDALGIDEYMDFDGCELGGKVLLDGVFTAEELRRIASYMELLQKEHKRDKP